MMKKIVLIIFLGVLYNPFSSFSQDSIPVAEDLNEEKELKFQQFFFKALSEKSIKNYQKAIENLEVCNEVLPQNVSIYFEFSKNYLFLNKLHQAKQYIRKALEQEPNNIWMLEHLVSIYKTERNYNEAITVQEKIVKINSKKRDELIRLYYLNRNYDRALTLINVLEKENGLPRNLKQLKRSLEIRKTPIVKLNEEESVANLLKAFENDRTSFRSLKKLLDLAIMNDQSTFHHYSKLGIDLFPAQPYVYLMRGKSLQVQKKHQESVNVLMSGLDFVIDNPNLEVQFYEEMAKVYQSLNNTKKVEEYKNKAKKIKSIK